jgi:hypothetical protein
MGRTLEEAGACLKVLHSAKELKFARGRMGMLGAHHWPNRDRSIRIPGRLFANFLDATLNACWLRTPPAAQAHPASCVSLEVRTASGHRGIGASSHGKMRGKVAWWVRQEGFKGFNVSILFLCCTTGLILHPNF